MTREEMKELLPIIQEWVEGKTLEYYNTDTGEWEVVTKTIFINPNKYRIKPEPKYRPFETKEECWNEMLKHQPIGWLREKANKKEMVHIGRIYDISDDVLITLSINEGRNDSSNYFFRAYTFTDGAPFGIKEE